MTENARRIKIINIPLPDPESGIQAIEVFLRRYPRAKLTWLQSGGYGPTVLTCIVDYEEYA